ncbi:MAG: hypothetical protein AB7V59_19870 [Gammaproteobacteria bacterium]
MFNLRAPVLRTTVPSRCRTFAALLCVVATAHGAPPCPTGHRAVLEGSASNPGGVIHQVLHLRKPASPGYDGEWLVFRFEQTMTHAGGYPQNVTQTVQDKATDGTPITSVIEMTGNQTRVVMEGKIALLIAKGGRLRHHTPGMMDGTISGQQISLRWLPPPNPNLTGVITQEPDPVLRVAPESGFLSAGAHSANVFKPASAHYTLTNCDTQPITVAGTASAPWLAVSPAGGVIAPNASLAVTVALTGDFRTWDDGVYRERIDFRNVTTHRGDTYRPAELHVKPHRWQVTLTGHETDYKSASGKVRPGERLDMRFQYTLKGTFEIGRKKGKWRYQNGVATAADLQLKPLILPPDWWNVKPPYCFNCPTSFKIVAGRPLGGILHPPGDPVATAVQLSWWPFYPKARMWAQLKPHVTCTPMPQCRNSATYQGGLTEYGSDHFHQRVSAEEVPLKDGPHPYSPLKDADRMRFVYTLKRVE